MKNLLLISTNLILAVILFTGCPLYEAALEDTASNFSTSVSSSSSILITPSNSSVSKGNTITFTASGAVTPVNWSSGNSEVGEIDSVSGVFTASDSASGETIITATDANGDTGTTTLTVS